MAKFRIKGTMGSLDIAMFGHNVVGGKASLELMTIKIVSEVR